MARRVGFGEPEPPRRGGALVWAALAVAAGAALFFGLGPAEGSFLAAAGLSPLRLALLAVVAAVILYLLVRGGARQDLRDTGRRDPNPPRDPPPQAPAIRGAPARETADGVRRLDQAEGAAHRVVGCFTVLFLSVWLVFWTAGIVFAFSAFLDEMSNGFGPHLFLLIWIAFALVGWVVVARFLLKTLFKGAG